MLSLNLDHQVVMSAWEQMGAEHFDEAPLSVPDHFELDLAGIEAGMQSNTVPSDFCVPSPTSKGSHASDFDFPWSLQNVIVKQEQFSSLPELKSSTAAPWQTSMMIPTSSLQPVGLQRAGSTAGSALASVQVKQEAMEVPRVQSPSSSSSQDVAVVPDVRRSAPCSSPATSSSAAAVVPQSIPMVAPAAHQIHRPQALPISAPAPVPAPVAVGAPPQPRPMVGLADGEFARTRQECLERYREKKARRLYTKKIRYQLRKINADKRPRIKGRFVKKEELEEYMRGKPGPLGAQGHGQCPELAAFSHLAALELPHMGHHHHHHMQHDGELLDPNMFDDDSSEFDQEELDELGL